MTSEKLSEEQIFKNARKISSTAERKKYCEAACGEDVALRNRVEQLLAVEHADANFLESPPPGLGPIELQTVTEQPGDTIGKYKLLQKIGEGGMGTVFMAEQQEPVARRVALKLIKPGMDTRQVVNRFEAERQALAMMDHPHIAKILDAGATESGRPYFVMELVDGTPITQYCDEHQLTPRERLQLFLPICRAVQHAHNKSVIHRDLKPSNILVVRYDDKAVPKIIDFGVAKAVGQRLTEQTMFTQHGQIVGTIDYMSPEQAQFNQLDVDTRSDIYSLGVLLYELLTGETPFDKQRLHAAAFDELVRIIREEEPPRPSIRLSSSAILPAVAANRHIEPYKLSLLMRGELDWIVMKAMEKDRNRRYETASAFASDVQHYLNDEAVVACPPSAAYRVRKFARRNKTVIATTVAVSLSLLVGTCVAGWQAIRASQDRDWAVAAEELAKRRLENERLARRQAEQSEARANQQSARAESEAAVADAILRFLQNDLLAQANPNLEPDRNISLRTILDRAARQIDGRFKNQPRVEAGVRHMIGGTYLALGEYTQAESHLKRALELRREHLGAEHPDCLNSMNNLAALYTNLGRYAEAETLQIETLKTRRNVLGDKHPQTLSAMSNLAATCLLRGELERCESLLAEALPKQRSVLGPQHPDTLTSTNVLAGLYKRRKQYAQAATLIAGTLEIQRDTLGSSHPSTLVSVNNLAMVFERQGRHDEAETLFLEALSKRRRVLGEEHPQTLVTLDNLAKLYEKTRRYADAEQSLNEYLAVLRRNPPADDLTLADALLRLGGVKLELRKFDEAEPILRESLRIREAHESEGRLTYRTKGMLGTALLGQHRCFEAETLIAGALAKFRHTLGNEHPCTLKLMYHLALCQMAQQDYAAAELLCVELLSGRRRILGEDHPQTLRSMMLLARLYQAAGRFDEAGDLLDRFLSLAPRKHSDEESQFSSMLQRLVTFYETRATAGDADRAERYRTLLETR